VRHDLLSDSSPPGRSRSLTAVRGWRVMARNFVYDADVTGLDFGL